MTIFKPVHLSNGFFHKIYQLTHILLTKEWLDAYFRKYYVENDKRKNSTY